MKVRLIRLTNKPIETIYEGYRVCYAKDMNSVFLEKHNTDEKKCDFIVPLMLEGHSSPLEHVSFTFEVEGISRACLAQLTRHRTFKFNVMSQRYVDAKNFDFVMPNLDYIPDDYKKTHLEYYIKHMFEEIREMYCFLIEHGLKKEDARAILPQATTCNLIVTMDLNNFRNFLKQRLCKHAQQEIRELAQEMVKLLKPHIPFVDYKVLRCQKGLCNECKFDK